MTYIDPRHKAFSHLDRLAGWQAGIRPSPVTIEWDLSNRCSLGCQACHFAHTHSRGPWVGKERRLPMAFESTGDLADTGLVKRTIGELAQGGVRGIVWTGGGEPTLHPHWREIMHHAERCGLEQGMYTLGGHLSMMEARELSHVATWVVVSLDAEDAESYAKEKGVQRSRFDDACNGIQHLIGGEAVIGVSFLLHANNWIQTFAMLRLARKLGATYTTFRPAVHFNADAPAVPTDQREWIREAWPALVRLADQPDVELDLARFAAYRDWHGHGYTSCFGIRLNATITPDGRVWICPNRRGMASSCLGDLREESFASIWARHPGQKTVDSDCRVMCRLHQVNETLAAVYTPRQHEAFV